jgi:hypothetical protein
MERGAEPWLAPFISGRWLASGQEVSVRNAPTRFGKVSYRIKFHADQGYVEATIWPPDRITPAGIAIPPIAVSHTQSYCNCYIGN